MKKWLLSLIGVVAMTGPVLSQSAAIPFDDAHWNLANARVAEFLGRSGLMGTAILKDLEFEDGVIEYDLAVTGARSYPGVFFRMQPDGTRERFYLRPHRSGRVAPSLYADVLQYVPSWNRLDSWQLYSGPGYTAGAVIPTGRWFHVKIEVRGSQARVFIDGAPAASLEIPLLRLGLRKGGIALVGPSDGTAYFSQLTVSTQAPAAFSLPQRQLAAPGFVREWQVSQALPSLSIDDSGSAPPAVAANLTWREIQPDEFGLIDIARVQGRVNPLDTVFLRTVIPSERDEVRPYKFGYSDAVAIYLNGVKIFSGDSSYQGRDPSFLGIIGLFDTLSLPLKAGANELLVELSEGSGGWGFQLQDAQAELRAPGVTALWQTGKTFAVPESVAYDSTRRMLYVSNYDPFHPGQGAISELALSGGEPKTLIDGLHNPTGLVVYENMLYAVEATAVAEIDIANRQIARRIEVPGAVTLNDIAVDAAGTLFVSDLPQSVIYRIKAGKAEPWLRGPAVIRPNGVCVAGSKLAFVNVGDGSLRLADLKTGQITLLATLPGGLLDGLAVLPDGAFLVSHNEGRLYRVEASGAVTLLLDLSVTGVSIADFVVVAEPNRLVFPSFYDGRVMAVGLPAKTK